MINFPPEKEEKDAFFGLQLSYYMDNQKDKDRNGRVRFQVWPARKMAEGHSSTQPVGGTMGTGGGHTGALPAGGTIGAGGGHTGNSPAGGMGGMMEMGGGSTGTQLADGTRDIAEKLYFGNYQLFVPEVRYWVGMNVHYNPGKPFVLASLLVGLVGIIITMIGRMTKKVADSSRLR